MSDPGRTEHLKIRKFILCDCCSLHQFTLSILHQPQSLFLFKTPNLKLHVKYSELQKYCDAIYTTVTKHSNNSLTVIKPILYI